MTDRFADPYLLEGSLVAHETELMPPPEVCFRCGQVHQDRKASKVTPSNRLGAVYLAEESA